MTKTFVHIGNKPTIGSLMKYRDDIAPFWRDLGKELLQEEYAYDALMTIERDHPTDVRKCCEEMFRCWLELDVEASWNKLIRSLHRIDFDCFITQRIGRENLNGKFYYLYVYGNSYSFIKVIIILAQMTYNQVLPLRINYVPGQLVSIYRI